METHPSEVDARIARARAGDAATLGRLLEQYRPYLTLLARLQIGRQLQGKADPADVVQEVFLEGARSFCQFRGRTEAEFLGWLRQVLASKLGELFRRYIGARRRDVRREQDLTAELDQSSHDLAGLFAARGSSPSQQAARREQAALLAEILERLPEHYREVIFLHHMEGLSLPDVARRMGRTADGVEKLWARALARLRGELGEMP
jgi:RNA polymerase sigma-70 factor (ECF subfamily)